MNLINEIEDNRKKASYDIELKKQRLFEQYFTPNDISVYMSNLFSNTTNKELKILDAGAGTGNLGAITALKYLKKNPDSNIHLTSIELDSTLIKYIEKNLGNIKELYKNFKSKVYNKSFYSKTKKLLEKRKLFDRIIINPPYSLTSTCSEEDQQILKELDVHTPNSYSNFIELSYRLLSEDGELVAIVPRSFCNGTRFTKFRIKLLNSVKIEFIHSFESRKEVFKEYGIFQEVLIIKLTKRNIRKTSICISDKLKHPNCEKFNFDKITFKNDPYKFIHIPSKHDDYEILDKISKLPSSLKQLGLNISTGKVVEYREPDLIQKKKKNSATVIYQRHIKNGIIDLSSQGKSKPYLSFNDNSLKKMITSGNYIIMKRMSYKENKKRINSAILTHHHFINKYMTIENHLNYIHQNNKGIDKYLAVGLNCYLNSEILDKYIRRFNGHTQINASDILSLPMPTYNKLIEVGTLISNTELEETKIETILFNN